jgi:hypothetical protein
MFRCFDYYTNFSYIIWLINHSPFAQVLPYLDRYRPTSQTRVFRICQTSRLFPLRFPFAKRKQNLHTIRCVQGLKKENIFPRCFSFLLLKKVQYLILLKRAPEALFFFYSTILRHTSGRARHRTLLSVSTLHKRTVGLVPRSFL